MNIIPINPSTTPINTIKPTFYNLVVLHDFDYPTLQVIAQMAGVEEDIVSAMFTTNPIYRADAEKILVAFSEYTGHAYTLDTVRVALLPTFEQIYTTHNLDFAKLATAAGVPHAIIDMLLVNEPVPIRDAGLVLAVISRLVGRSYTLDDVDLKLTDRQSP
jgi:hypothetical protein